MSKVSHGELDAMIQAQQKLLDNIENLEKQAPRNMSFTARAARAFSNNKAGAGVLVMLASCTVMSLNMLSNKREYQMKKDELDEALKLSERARVRAVKEAEASEAKVQHLQRDILTEIRTGGWGMAARIEKLVSQGGEGSVTNETAPTQKIAPKMV